MSPLPHPSTGWFYPIDVVRQRHSQMLFHDRDFELEPCAWYRELRSLQMIRHMYRKNYAMVSVSVMLYFATCSSVNIQIWKTNAYGKECRLFTLIV
jgi:hypothetical protein